MSFHLLACISAHGYGHLAMTAPALNSLAIQYEIKLTVRTMLPEPLLRELITVDFDIVPEASDFGMIMRSSIEVDLLASKKQYVDLHNNWEFNVSAEAERLRQLSPNLILANAPYLAVVASKKIDVPCVAFCSLNWADIYYAYYGSDQNEDQKIVNEMQQAYNSADFFVCPEPSMPMEQMLNRKVIGPVSLIGLNLKAKICEQLKILDSIRLVLISPGGVKTEIPIDEWPQSPDIHWITSWENKSKRTDISSVTSLDFAFNDLLSSCDAVITKPGYGTVTNTACNTVPALYVLRGDWAEEACLVKWWECNNRIKEISVEQFYSGDVLSELEQLWNLAPSVPVEPSGVEELVSIIADYIPSGLE